MYNEIDFDNIILLLKNYNCDVQDLNVLPIIYLKYMFFIVKDLKFHDDFVIYFSQQM